MIERYQMGERIIGGAVVQDQHLILNAQSVQHLQTMVGIVKKSVDRTGINGLFPGFQLVAVRKIITVQLSTDVWRRLQPFKDARVALERNTLPSVGDEIILPVIIPHWQ